MNRYKIEADYIGTNGYAGSITMEVIAAGRYAAMNKVEKLLEEKGEAISTAKALSAIKI
ncbi:MAG: hypothetical protein KGJ90_06455 [Patescibacteria group bacterium]|nr:hypothetical protein [Patescibacteria group bacterium]